jgi:drug/metabolite transporter (DMT)-like permease
MHWTAYATMSLLLVGTFNTILEGSKSTMNQTIHTKIIFTSTILMLAGAISAMNLCYHYHAHRTEFKQFFKAPRLFHVLAPAMCLCTYLVTNTLALSGGGGVAMGIINLNMIVTLLAGSYFYKDKINATVLIAMIVGVASLNIAVYESMAIN